MQFVSNKIRTPITSEILHLEVKVGNMPFQLTVGNYNPHNTNWYTERGVFEQEDDDVEVLWLDKEENPDQEADDALKMVNKLANDIFKNTEK